MTDITINILQEKEDGLYKGQEKILNFVPRITAVKEIKTTNNTEWSYDVEIYRDGQEVDCINIRKLYIDNWFKLSYFCPSAALKEKHKKMIEQYLEEQVVQTPTIKEVFIDTYGWWEYEEQKVFFRKNIITRNLQVDITTLQKEGSRSKCFGSRFLRRTN